MGFPPPPAGPPPDEAGVDASIDFPPSPDASLCGFSLKLPRFKFGLKLPTIPFPPPIPFPFFSFALSCDLSNPIDITAGLGPGGGRKTNTLPDPDLQEAA